MEKLIIFGSGGHAKVVQDVAKGSFEVICFVGMPDEIGEINNIPIIHEGTELDKIFNSGIKNFIVAIGDNDKRAQLYHNLVSVGFKPVNVISPNAYISDSVKIGSGNLIVHGAIINPFTIIGNNNIINTNATIDHDNIIGNNIHIAPGCNLAGKVTIGDGTLIGIGTKIIPNITIGHNVIIGAGSVVIREILSNQKVVGVPANKIIN